jgi:hypothetical protein
MMRLSLRQLFVFTLFMGLLILTLRPIADPDFWWHLRTGELIVQSQSIPHADPFSFTVAGKSWIAHEWLSEVLIYLIYHLGGKGLLLLSFASLISGTFFLTYRRCPPGSRPYLAGFALLLGALATAPTWGVRPQMISLFLTALFLFLLDRYRQTGSRKFILPLPVLMLVWANLHAEFILGPVVLGVYILGELVEVLANYFLKKSQIELSSFRNMFWMLGVLAVCLAVIAINPNGFHLYIYPFETLVSPSMQQFIQEWASPDFHQLEWQPLIWLMLALLGLGMFGRKSIAITNILLVVIFGYAALHSMRHVPLFAITAVPVLAEQAGALIQIRYETSLGKRLSAWLAPGLVLLALLVVGARFISVVNQQSNIEKDNFPVAAVDWIAENRPSGNLFNTYGWGGYLIWRLYPDYQVYIDGRADVYGDRFIYAYMDIYRGLSNWQSSLASANVRLVLVEPGSGLAGALHTDPSWAVAYQDKLSVLFIKK